MSTITIDLTEEEIQALLKATSVYGDHLKQHPEEMQSGIAENILSLLLKVSSARKKAKVISPSAKPILRIVRTEEPGEAETGK